VSKKLKFVSTAIFKFLRGIFPLKVLKDAGPIGMCPHGMDFIELRDGFKFLPRSDSRDEKGGADRKKREIEV